MPAPMRALSLVWQTGAKTKNKVNERLGNERLGAERPGRLFDYSLALASSSEDTVFMERM